MNRVFVARGSYDESTDSVRVDVRRLDDRVLNDDGEVIFEQWGSWERIGPADSLRHRNHSPDGFAWGYAGSGPSQLALALLLAGTRDLDFALNQYQAFKFETVAKLEWPESWQLRVDADEWGEASSRIVSGNSIDSPGIAVEKYGG